MILDMLGILYGEIFEMKILKIYDIKDYDSLSPRLVRNSVKAIIIMEGKIAMMYFKKHKLYDFPGGGIEDGETNIEALIREIKEETGLIIKPLSVREFGKYVVIHKDNSTDGINEKHFHYYLCNVEDIRTEPRLTEEEIKNELQFKFVDIDEAIAANELNMHIQREVLWAEGPTYILKLVKDTLA